MTNPNHETPIDYDATRVRLESVTSDPAMLDSLAVWPRATAPERPQAEYYARLPVHRRGQTVQREGGGVMTGQATRTEKFERLAEAR
jgi:hypothetical protein